MNTWGESWSFFSWAETWGEPLGGVGRVAPASRRVVPAISGATVDFVIANAPGNTQIIAPIEGVSRSSRKDSEAEALLLMLALH